jgi:hypothetical protein
MRQPVEIALLIFPGFYSLLRRTYGASWVSQSPTLDVLQRQR